MAASTKLAQIIFVVGPTATGKSDLAVSLAEHYRAEVINADSIQFYDQIEIGTAKPGPELTSRVRHHLLSFVDPPKTLSAGDFTRVADQILAERIAAGIQNFVIVGGSGFYLQALEKGMVPAPVVSEKIRDQVKVLFESEGSEKLWDEVEKRDPEYALKVSKQDSYRVQRALEILLSGPTSISQTQRDFAASESDFRKKYGVHKIALDLNRDFLRKRIGLRTEQMLANAWTEEVEHLRAQGFADWAPLKSVGYFEIGEYLDSKIKRSDLHERIVTSTQQLAKKQRTWFKRDQENHWIVKGESNPQMVFEEAKAVLRLD